MKFLATPIPSKFNIGSHFCTYFHNLFKQAYFFTYIFDFAPQILKKIPK
jgi:hypothetical protein